MKRVLHISFTALATLMFMAHAVVPHHHHDQVQVCFAHDIAQESHEENCSHDTPNEKSGERCFLATADIEVPCSRLLSYSPPVDWVFMTCCTEMAECQHSFKVESRVVVDPSFRVDGDTFYIVYVCRTLCLRASPIC